MSKVISSGPGNIRVSGGKSNHMKGKTGVGAQQPGISSTTQGSPTGGKGGKAVRGGSGHMFGKSGVKAAKPL